MLSEIVNHILVLWFCFRLSDGLVVSPHSLVEHVINFVGRGPCVA